MTIEYRKRDSGELFGEEKRGESVMELAGVVPSYTPSASRL